MSIETVKKDLREMMKLTRKQVLPSAGKIEFTPVIATEGDDRWGSYVAPSDGYLCIFGGEFSSIDIASPKGLQSTVWRIDNKQQIAGAWLIVEAGESVRYHLSKDLSGRHDHNGVFIPLKGSE